MAAVSPPASEFSVYLASLQRRLADIEGHLKQLTADEHQREGRLDLTHAELRAAINVTKRDIQSIEDDLLQQVQRTKGLVASFKDSLRAQDLTRLQQRIDAWRGEQYILRSEFKRVAKKAVETKNLGETKKVVETTKATETKKTVEKGASAKLRTA